MKNRTKIYLLVIALLTAFCLASCSNPSNNSSSGGSGGGSSSDADLLASFKGTMTEPGSGTSKELIFKFYKDSTWTYNEGNGSIKGTYTGDVTKDGEGTMTLSFDDRTQVYTWKIEGTNFKWGAGGFNLWTFTIL